MYNVRNKRKEGRRVNKKKKVTLFLDTDTISKLEAIANVVAAGSNKSFAVRYLAKEAYEKLKLDEQRLAEQRVLSEQGD